MIILVFPHKSREQQQMTSFFMIRAHEIGCTVSLFQTRNKKELVSNMFDCLEQFLPFL